MLLVLQGVWADDGEIPELAEVPAGIAEPYHTALVEQRKVLVDERSGLKELHRIHNQVQVPEGSDEEANLREEGKKLAAAITQHTAASKKFNQDVADFADLQAVFARGLANANNPGAPLNAPFTNDTDHRSAFDYAKVIDQFQVDTSARYEPGTFTYCNIFAWDVTRAMGAEIPHYVLKNHPVGASAVDELGKFYAPANKREELDANKTVAWLEKSGSLHGWKSVEAEAAQKMANGGHPAIAIWPNPDAGQPGHVAMVRPGSVPLSPSGPAIAQAGGLVLDANHLDDGFKDPKIRKAVHYWSHE